MDQSNVYNVTINVKLVLMRLLLVWHVLTIQPDHSITVVCVMLDSMIQERLFVRNVQLCVKLVVMLLLVPVVLRRIIVH